MDYRKVIRQEAETMNTLHSTVHKTASKRGLSKSHKDLWYQACADFHSYKSSIDNLMEEAMSASVYTDKELQEFVVCFLEEDPMFFRSGYIKEELLRRIKRSDIKEALKVRLRHVLIDAVKNRPNREFKCYCQLAACIADKKLASDLRPIMDSHDSAIASRAKLMLSYIEVDKNK